MGHNSFVYLHDGFGSQLERTSAVAAFIQHKELDSSGLLVNDRGEVSLSPDESWRVARFCDQHYYYDVSDSRKEGLQAKAAFEFRHSKKVIVLS